MPRRPSGSRRRTSGRGQSRRRRVWATKIQTISSLAVGSFSVTDLLDSYRSLVDLNGLPGHTVATVMIQAQLRADDAEENQHTWLGLTVQDEDWIPTAFDDAFLNGVDWMWTWDEFYTQREGTILSLLQIWQKLGDGQPLWVRSMRKLTDPKQSLRMVVFNVAGETQNISMQTRSLLLLP